ncbi:MAG: [protein-PII] uridylyltransferase [Candidatus Binatota bacterium]|nr:[protein-PII] uridylyltransferase [Candidatus Binatota bacterium]
MELSSVTAELPRTDLELPPAGGQSLGAVAKAYLLRAREALRERHFAGASGAEIVAAYTEVIDRLIRYLFDAAVAEFESRNARPSQKLAVFAQGGYGRAELSPFSDIDLLFLYSWKVSPFVETVAEKILYSLWDTGLEVGHAVRNVPECVRLAASDFKVKTALLDARFLCGEEMLRKEFDKAIEESVLRQNAGRFFREKLAESAERHRHYGDSVYLLEPHLKEGAGGLRDLHTAFWMARVKFKVRTLREMVQKGVVPERDLATVIESRDFLWRVRNTLHFLADGHQDHLTFEYQERVAEVLGYHDADERRAVERFMRDYYLHAANVSRFAKLVIERCVERASPYRRLSQIFGRRIRPGVRIVNGEITIEDPNLLKAQPVNVVSIFLDAQRHGASLGARARQLVRDSVPLLGAERESPAVVRAFREILRGRARVCESLREMYELEVLDQLLPEFGQLRCMVIRDFYHIYTVDEHTLRAVAELESLAAGAHRRDLPLLTQVMHEVERPEIVYLSMLLHDVGKGHGHGHSDRGARLAAEAARRFAFHEDDVAEIERLVRHHLLMSHVAQHRDLDDERVVIDFAKTLGTVETLKKLTVMTFADMRAVAPNVWNNWRQHLLEELYLRTLEVFEKGDFVEEDRAARLERRKERLRQALASREAWVRDLAEEMLRTLPPSYFFSANEEGFAHHLEVVRQYREAGGGLATSVRHFPDREFSEFTVCTQDRPGLFSMIAGVLAAYRMNILAAQITTGDDGTVLDVFRVSHAEPSGRVLDDSRWETVRSTLDAVLRGEVSVESLVAETRRPSILTRKFVPRIPTSVTIDNQGSDHHSLLEVSTQDDVGVLFAITYALHRLGCTIHLARISTVLRHVYDVFYVNGSSGEKLTDPEWIARVCDGVRGALEENARQRDAANA